MEPGKLGGGVHGLLASPAKTRWAGVHAKSPAPARRRKSRRVVEVPVAGSFPGVFTGAMLLGKATRGSGVGQRFDSTDGSAAAQDQAGAIAPLDGPCTGLSGVSHANAVPRSNHPGSLGVRAMSRSVGPLVGDFSRVPNDLTAWTHELESVSRRVANRLTTKRKASHARRTPDNLEDVESLNHGKHPRQRENPRSSGQPSAEDGECECNSPHPIRKENRARKWALPHGSTDVAVRPGSAGSHRHRCR